MIKESVIVNNNGGRIAFLSYLFVGHGKFYDPMRHSGQLCLTELE